MERNDDDDMCIAAKHISINNNIIITYTHSTYTQSLCVPFSHPRSYFNENAFVLN